MMRMQNSEQIWKMLTAQYPANDGECASCPCCSLHHTGV